MSKDEVIPTPWKDGYYRYKGHTVTVLKIEGVNVTQPNIGCVFVDYDTDRQRNKGKESSTVS